MAADDEYDGDDVEVEEAEEEDVMAMATEIALAALTGLLASGQYADNVQAAAAAAWTAPEHFLRSRSKWLATMQAIYGGG